MCFPPLCLCMLWVITLFLLCEHGALQPPTYSLCQVEWVWGERCQEQGTEEQQWRQMSCHSHFYMRRLVTPVREAIGLTSLSFQAQHIIIYDTSPSLRDSRHRSVHRFLLGTALGSLALCGPSRTVNTDKVFLFLISGFLIITLSKTCFLGCLDCAHLVQSSFLLWKKTHPKDKTISSCPNTNDHIQKCLQNTFFTHST